MADRVKYFMLGLLFLVVAGVIAYDRWNSRDGIQDEEVAAYERDNSGKIFIAPDAGDDESNLRTPPINPKPESGKERPLIINPLPDDPPADKPPVVKPKPNDRKAASKERVHVVRSGEALEKISRQYYPDKVYKGIDLIVKANGLRSANVITEGQKLIIPAMDARGGSRPVVVKKETPVKRAAAKKPSSGVPSTYVVKSSDGDLYKICRKFYGSSGEGARIARIMRENNLISIHVKAGTRLKLSR